MNEKPDPSASEASERPTVPPRQPSSDAETTPPLTESYSSPLAPREDSGRSESPALPSIPGYEILAELGRGGMGVVYKARQTKLNRIVALKMILAGGYAGQAELQRFRTEAQAIAALHHPNIVQIHEVGEHDGLPFFSLEFCSGGALAQKLQGTPLPAQEAAALVEKLARAMQAAHQKGVIHRDLKPGNVLLQSDSTAESAEARREDNSPRSSASSPVQGFIPKITDFGLAKKMDTEGQTATGAVMGTPSYMAPEQSRCGTSKRGRRP